MKVIFVLLLLVFYTTKSNAEHRYKFRGPPLPPRPPKSPMYVKKWHMNTVRLPPARSYYQRPITSINSLYKSHRMVNRPKIPAVTPLILPPTVWKIPNLATLKTSVIAKPTLVHLPISTNSLPEYEYRISEPIDPVEPTIQSNTVKQVDEKGPIHTIPAPNLSLTDKPIVVSGPQPLKQNSPQIQTVPIKAYQLDVNSHQYQVTEHNNDQTLIDPITGKTKYYAPDPDPSLPAPKVPLATDPFSTPSNSKPQFINKYTVTDQPLVRVHQQELLHLLQTYPQEHLLNNYDLSLFQQPQLQQSHGVLALSSNLQPQNTLVVPESNYNLAATQQMVSQETPNYIKHDFQPQYQTFNYDEQTKQNSVPGSLFEQANYNLEEAATNQIHNPALRNTEEYSSPLSLTQNLMQPYSQPSIDSMLVGNIVNSGYNPNINLENMPDPSITYSQITNHQTDNNDQSQYTINKQFIHYTTLPSREIAEKLASLQAAGEMLSKQHDYYSNDDENDKKDYTPLRIVVPDESDKNNLNSEDSEIQASNQNEIIQDFDISKNDRKDTDTHVPQSSEDTLKERFYDYEDDYSHENDEVNEGVNDHLIEKEQKGKQTYEVQAHQANKT